MKTMTFISGILLASFFITIINANDGKKYSNNLSQERLLDALVEAKWRQLLLSKYKESKEESQKYKLGQFDQESDEENRGRTLFRRKLVGISDNPF